MSSPLWSVVAALAGIVVILSTITLHSRPDTATSGTASAQPAPRPAIVQSGPATIRTSTVGCPESVMDKATAYHAAGDSAAVQNLFITGLLSGLCLSFEPGESVFVLDYSLWKSRTHLKKPGSLQSVWIPGALHP